MEPGIEGGARQDTKLFDDICEGLYPSLNTMMTLLTTSDTIQS